MSKRKWAYITFIGFLTSTTLSATYWQYSRYQESLKRWNIIRSQLIKDQPINIQSLSNTEIFPYRYVEIFGELMSTNKILVKRAKDSRTGYLVFKPLRVQDNKCIVALEGWVPDSFTQAPRKNEQIKTRYRGLLRVSEKKNEYDKTIQGMNTYFDLEQAIENFTTKTENIVVDFSKYKDYYFQILKPIRSDQNEVTYPYQYSVDNFEMPYLTPSKHRDYAIFWASTSLVGLWAMFKVLRMR